MGDRPSFIYDKNSNTYCGRKPRNWGEITLFYFVFYSALLAYFFSMMCFFSTFVDPIEPTLQGEISFIKYPGVHFRPVVDLKSNVIKFSKSKADSYAAYTKDLDKALEPYKKASQSAKWGDFLRSDCTDKNPAGSFACRLPYVRLDTNQTFDGIGDCTSKNNYGYGDGKPCVLVRLNKVYGWTPARYTANDLKNTAAPDYYSKNVNGSSLLIPLWCQGKTAADLQNLGGNTSWSAIFPNGGLFYYAYPYLNQYGYLQPFVLFQFNHPVQDKDITVVCQAWAPNIKYNDRKHEGMTEFVLHVGK